MDAFLSLLEDPRVEAAVVFVVTIVGAYVVQWFIHGVVGVIVKRSESTLDDAFFEILRRPIFATALAIGAHWIASDLLGPKPFAVVSAAIRTALLVVWVLAGFFLSGVTFRAMATSHARRPLVNRRTVPMFDMVMKISLLGAGLYGLFVIWDLDLSAWLASAGIAGIAIGFAAKDTLANLFAGIFIIADAPYKVGDYVVIEDGLRGRVTHMGMRSTRILTRDDLEVTVPNSVIGGARIINEDGGPHPKQRIRVPVSVAYGSDIDQVRDVLLQCPKAVNHVCAEPRPQVRFRTFGASGLEFELLVWLDDAHERGSVIDVLNCKVYKAFAAAGIEIPYSKHDVYIKQMPRVAS